MGNNRILSFIKELLSEAGITLNGPNPWDIHVHNEKLYPRLLKSGSLGFGEAYIDGWWDCEQIDTLIARILQAHLDERVYDRLSTLSKFFLYQFKKSFSLIYNFQSKRRSKAVAHRHYNLGNELFSRMLDPTMNYSCAYWKDSETLEDAQLAKLALICGKLQLQPGMRVLDIGCGWGGFLNYAAMHYGIEGVGVTISKEQHEYAKKRCEDLPIEIRLQDYRDLNETFDAIVSVGMFEHVGEKNYKTFMEIVSRCLNDHSLFLLHTIGGNKTLSIADPWINKYIFPNGLIPSIPQIGKAHEGLFVMEDWHNMGADYDKTLMAWFQNFNEHWNELKEYYDDRFYRMWEYYLKSCAGAFRARDLQLWQIVFSKNGVPGGYRSIR